MSPPKALPDPIQSLRALQRLRRAVIRQKNAIGNATHALVRSLCGYKPDMTKPQRAKLVKRAAAIVRALEKGEPRKIEDVAIATEAAEFVENSLRSRQPWETMLAGTEKQMKALAVTLPAYSFVKPIKGFGDLGFAIIIGEAGNLSNYPTPSHLWKRLGLAVIDGKRQRRVTGKNEAIEHGYSPSRRAEIWTIGDSFMKHQGKEEEGTETAWRKLYSARRTHTAVTHPDWSDGHSNNDSVRYVMKRLIRDLWRAWRAATEWVSTN